jgi:hypothetical protein
MEQKEAVAMRNFRQCDFGATDLQAMRQSAASICGF